VCMAAIAVLVPGETHEVTFTYTFIDIAAD